MAPSVLGIGALAADAPYPNKPVRFIIPFAPGGGNDIVGRMLGAKFIKAEIAKWARVVALSGARAE